MIVEDPIKGVVVPDLTERTIVTSEELHEIITSGNQRRQMAATGANQFSSRSHALLIISVESRSRVKELREEIVYSKL